MSGPSGGPCGSGSTGVPGGADGPGPRPRVLDSITEAIGGTPVVRLRRVTVPGRELLVKVEAFNPGGSVKDRIALAMVEEAERQGLLRPGGTIVEATSGNTGIGLAVVAAARGYRLVLTMPEDMSQERRRLLEWLGAEVVLTPAREGMSGAVWAAEEIARQRDGFLARQFENPANPAAHRRTTAREILAVTGGRLDVFVAGVGTGGTLTGVAEVLRQAIPGVHVVAVEPARAAVLSGGRPGPTRIQGIGAGFVPGVLRRDLIDEVVTVEDEEAVVTARRLAQEEGLLCGFSAGAAVAAALRVLAARPEGTRALAVLPDTGERYLSLMEG
ncbi:MAG: cysteine synthase A [Clostridia bacterium]|nr:cysteine synthase A [Clostridia bacterium]